MVEPAVSTGLSDNHGEALKRTALASPRKTSNQCPGTLSPAPRQVGRCVCVLATPVPAVNLPPGSRCRPPPAQAVGPAPKKLLFLWLMVHFQEFNHR